MATVSPIADRFQAALKLAVTCNDCGYTRIRTEGACPSCRADAELAAALAALRSFDDWQATANAAGMIRWAIEGADLNRGARPIEAIRVVRDPELPRGGRDDD